jgi:hypothetical protein
VTLYLVVKRGYQGVVKDREEAKKVPKDWASSNSSNSNIAIREEDSL